MNKDENQLALQEIKSLANELQIRIGKFNDDEVFAPTFDIGEVDFAFSLVEELVKKVRNQIELMSEPDDEEDEE